MTWLGQKGDPAPAPQQKSTAASTANTATTPGASSAPYTPASPAPREYESMAPASKGATIGKSIHIKGELTGSEDLAIEGKVEGKITLSGCRVTIGSSGQVTADIVAKTVIVGGQVKGSVRAEERVEVSSTGNLLGDVRAPRVVLVDGAKFKGAIDMDPASAGSSASASNSKSAASKSEPASTTPARDPMLTPEEPLYAKMES